MSVYILSVLYKKELDTRVIEEVRGKIELLYPDNKVSYSLFNYPDRNFKELDFDIQDIIFQKEEIVYEIKKLIQAIVIIFDTFDIDCDVIGGYNDTENAIQMYEKDRESNYMNFGLFGTKKYIPDSVYYWKLNDIVIYQSFEFDSMGVIF